MKFVILILTTIFLFSCSSAPTKSSKAKTKPVKHKTEQVVPEVKKEEIKSEEIKEEKKTEEEKVSEVKTDVQPTPVVKEEVTAVKAEPKKVILMVGGFGSRMFAMIGAIKELVSNGLKFDMMVASGGAALPLAMYSSLNNMNGVEWELFKLHNDMIWDFPILGRRIAQGKKLQKYLDGYFKNQNFTQMKIPLKVVLTNVANGEVVLEQSGKISEAVKESFSMPPLYASISQNKKYITGGLSDPFPIDKIRLEEPDSLIIVLDFYNTDYSCLDNTVEEEARESLLAFAISNNSRKSVSQADVVIRPKFGPICTMDFAKRADLMLIGKKSVENKIDEIREKQ